MAGSLKPDCVRSVDIIGDQIRELRGAGLISQTDPSKDWTLELHLEGLPAPLAMAFRDKASAEAMRLMISAAATNNEPSECGYWADHDGAEISARLKFLVAMRLARR